MNAFSSATTELFGSTVVAWVGSLVGRSVGRTLLIGAQVGAVGAWVGEVTVKECGYDCQELISRRKMRITAMNFHDDFVSVVEMQQLGS